MKHKVLENSVGWGGRGDQSWKTVTEQALGEASLGWGKMGIEVGDGLHVKTCLDKEGLGRLVEATSQNTNDF